MKNLLCVLLMSFVSCTQVSRPSEALTEKVIESIRYTKDDRTGLCFALLESANTRSLSTIVSFTCVPCSSIVNELK